MHINELRNIINTAMIKQGYNPFLPINTYSEEDIKRVKRILNTLIEEIDDVWKFHKGKYEQR